MSSLLDLDDVGRMGCLLLRRCYRFKVDMWALGVVVFLMLYGKYPFEGADQKAIVVRC